MARLKNAADLGISLDDLTRALRSAGEDIPSGSLSPQESVHCARVQTKRLAAALHLYKGLIPTNEYRFDKKHLKTTARMLSTSRDQDVIRKQLWACTRHLSARDQRKIKHWLHELIPGPGITKPEQVHRAKARLAAALKAWPKPHDVKAGELFARGTEEAFRKAKAAFQKAKKSGKASRFHRWRIRAKRLLLQLKLAASLGMDSKGIELKKLDKLQSQLGDLHDLHVAHQFISKHESGPQKAINHLQKRLNSERAALERKALKRGKKLFSAKNLRRGSEPLARP